MRYSDEDLQSYAEGNFKGNIQDIESFIQQNPNAQQSVELYKNLFAAFGTAYQQDHQPVNLPGKVASVINAKRSAREVRITGIFIGVIALAAIVVFVRNIIPVAQNQTVLILIAGSIMILLAWAFAKTELTERKKLFN